jgi:uncharacterized protein (TIGR00268 family)
MPARAPDDRRPGCALPQLADLQEALERDLRGRAPVLVAFSGGVDSAVVAALAQRAAGSRPALAVTAAAETLAGRELDHARRLAAEIGIVHRVVTYSELDDPEFVRNPAHRCYVCQGLRMSTMVRLARELGFAVVCDGTNASDVLGERPGLRAVREQGVYSPLLGHGIEKARVRGLAQALGLSAWDRPANACLSSRIPHGQPVTLYTLRRVEAAEDHLLDLGFRTVRVRADRREARVEVAAGEVARLREVWHRVEPQLLATGFDRAVLDPRGYRTGGADRTADDG